MFDEQQQTLQEMSKQQFCRTKRTCFLTAGPMFSFLSLNMICSPYTHDHKNGAFINTTWWGLYNGPLHLSRRPKSKTNEFFTLADNTRGIRGHSRKLVKFRSIRDCCKYFFSNRVINRWNQPDQRVVDASSIDVFKGRLNKTRETRMGFFMDWSTEP